MVGCYEAQKTSIVTVWFPDAEKMAHFARLLQSQEPTTDDIKGFMDGLALTSECTAEDIEHNAM
jgi:hypothetical protein